MHIIPVSKLSAVMKRVIGAYSGNTRATILAAFALMMPVIVGTVGMSVDLGRAYLVRARLGGAIDNAVLAAAASETTEAGIEQKVEDFFNANYPPEKLGVTYDLEVVINEDDISATVYADYHTAFMRVIGVPTITVGRGTTVRREVRGLEVVLVLDNTGSMASYNNIDALKTATENFINILFNAVSEPEDIKIGLVPYSNSVRVGLYGLGETPNGDPYGDGDVFVNLPPDMAYTTDRTSDDWYGCVVEHNPNGYSSGAEYVDNSKGQLWLDAGGNPDGHGWDPRDSNNDPYNSDVLDNYEGPWDVYAYGYVIPEGWKCTDLGRSWSNSRCSSCNGYRGKCTGEYCFCWLSDYSTGTNRSCPYAYIQPLTSNRDALLEIVNDMRPDGNTLGNIGMLWGSRLISPEPPFEEGADWDDQAWRKAVIMMTDGANTNDGIYSSFWFRNKHNLDVTDYNERFTETCAALKEKGVLIYTITFTSNIGESIKDYYRECATTPSQYYDAPSQQDLINVFEKISRELANLHITR